MRLKYIRIAALCTLATIACSEKEKLSPGNVFRVEVMGLNEDGSKMQFTDTNYTRMIFDEGDILWVNGHPFTLSFDMQDRQWVATNSTPGAQKIVSDYYYCLYTSQEGYNGATGYNESSHTYGNLALTNQVASRVFVTSTENPYDQTAQTTNTANIILAGATEDSIIRLYPNFAVLKFLNTSIVEYDFTIGFDSGKVPGGSSSVTPGNSIPSFTQTKYLTGVGKVYDDEDELNVYQGDFLLSTTDNIRNTGNTFDAKNMSHLIVPCHPGGVTTDVYIKRQVHPGGAIKYTKATGLHIEPGMVHQIRVL